MSNARVWGSRIAAAVAIVLLAAMLYQLVAVLGSPPPRKRGDWHRKYAWRAERYFPGQPQVIELCYAIEANDLDEIDRLVAAGADVNAKGVSNMTPLMWAYPDDKLQRFEKLLELGADPNVAVESELNTRGAIRQGQSVTYLVTLGKDVDYFNAVFRYDGDPDFVCQGEGLGSAPLIIHLIKWGGSDRRQRINSLIGEGANLDLKSSGGSTPAMAAVGWFGQYDLALDLLKSGADPLAYHENWITKLAHLVLREKTRPKSPEQAQSFAELYRWMEANGVDFAQAQADRDRWKSSTAYTIPAKQREREQEARRNQAAEARRRVAKQDLNVQEPADR